MSTARKELVWDIKKRLFRLSNTDLYELVKSIAADSQETIELNPSDEEGCMDYVTSYLQSDTLLELEDEGMSHLLILQELISNGTVQAKPGPSMRDKRGIVMVNFFNDYVTCSKTANLSDVADHFDHIKNVAGPDIIGFGGDYDGVSRMPEGLEDVSKVPNLVVELLRRGWTDEEVKAALGNNLLRVFAEVERVRDSQKNLKPDDVPITYEAVQNPCRTSYGYNVETGAGAVHSVSALTLLLTLALQVLVH